MKHRWLDVLPALCGLLALAGLTWAQFRGFDVLDEATYLLLYQNPADNPDTHTRFEHLARPVWLLCRENIVAFRFATLAIATAAVLVFWRTWRRLARDGVEADPGYTSLWPLWISVMAGLAWVPVALTYNSLGTLLLLFGLALLLGTLGFAGGGGLTVTQRLATGAGFAATLILLFLSKAPAAAAYLGWGVVLLLCSPRLSPRQRTLMSLGAGAIALGGLAWWGIAALRPDFDPTIPIAFAGVTVSPAWLFETCLRYLDEMGTLWSSALGVDLAGAAVPAALAGWAAWRLGRGADAPQLRALLLVVPVAVVAITAARGLWDGSFSRVVTGEPARFHLVMIVCLLPAWLAAAGRPLLWRAPVLVLLALPLTTSLGSTNAVHVTALHQVVFWTAAMLLMAREIGTVCRAPWFGSAIAAVLAVAGTCHLASSHLAKPYMFQIPLWRQTEPVAVGHPATMLRLDPALAGFIREVRGILAAQGFQSGDDVLGFFNLPGIVFAVGGKSPGAPWYFGTWYGDNDTDGGKLRQVPIERRQAAWLITHDDVARFRPRFLECGLDFPDGYERVGGSINPTSGLRVDVWKPRTTGAAGPAIR